MIALLFGSTLALVVFSIWESRRLRRETQEMQDRLLLIESWLNLSEEEQERRLDDGPFGRRG